MKYRVPFWCGLFGILFLSPLLASAQTISGTVTDSSGSIMPGVTVEASSPALIEQTRAVVTNEAGRYSIVNLRPGTYVVTFTLPGFSTVKREGIELTSEFTAQVNAELRVGAIEESITVTGESPVVDVQGTATPRVLTRDVMDALPTDRSVTALANTLPGTGPGPFGQIAYRGAATEAVTSVDGMRTTHLTGAGPGMTATPFNNAQFQEYSFSTAIESAETGQSGLRINLVPKEGGNQFSGSLYTSFTHDGWQSGNVDDELASYGFTDVKTLKQWDVNPSFGGPIKRDRLWFFGTFRSNGSDTQALDFNFDTNPDPFIYERGATGTLENWSVNGSGRLTYQASSKDKISGFYEKPYSLTPYSRNPQLGTNPPPEATVRAEGDNSNYGARWTRTHTAKLLLEASASKFDTFAYNDYGGNMEPWGAANVFNPPSGLPPAMAILDRVTNRQIGIANVAGGNESTTMTLASSATYVTGSHSLKGGFTYFNGTYKRLQTVAGNVTLAVNSLVSGGPGRRAESATLTLPTVDVTDIDGDWGFYVQDRWSLNRLTVNMGLRYDWFITSIPEQPLPPNRYLSGVTFAPQDVANLKDLSPRLGAAYDLFGTGKTAVKVAVARYVAGETVALTRAVNPMLAIATTDQRTWNDLNSDQTVLNSDGSLQMSELGPSTNLNFGGAIPQTRFDPVVQKGWFNRGYSWETNVSIQHEILPRISGTALWYRRTLGNQRANDNQRVTPADYDQFCLTAPTDPRLPGGGGERICGLADVKPAFRGLVDNVNTFTTNLGTGEGYKDIVDGFELSVNARLPGGAFVMGGLNLNRTLTGRCDVIDSPDVRFCETRTPFLKDIKLQGNYMLPLEIEVAANYMGLAGPEMLAAWAVPGAQVAAALGRPQTAASRTVALVEPGTQYEDMRHIFNFRFGRAFQVDRVRLKAFADLDNIFNSNALTSIRTQFGTEWLRPAGILSGRQVRLGAQIDF